MIISNKPHAANPAIALLQKSERQWRGVADAERFCALTVWQLQTPRVLGFRRCSMNWRGVGAGPWVGKSIRRSVTA
jgi:hypothetical protein